MDETRLAGARELPHGRDRIQVNTSPYNGCT